MGRCCLLCKEKFKIQEVWWIVNWKAKDEFKKSQIKKDGEIDTTVAPFGSLTMEKIKVKWIIAGINFKP